jgi:hypothetical protein
LQKKKIIIVTLLHGLNCTVIFNYYAVLFYTFKLNFMNTNFKLPKEFIELNKLVFDFNTGNNVRLFGEGKYLLLQGSRIKGYSLFVVLSEGKVIYKLLNAGLNKKSFFNAMDTLNNLSFMYKSTIG